MVDSYVHIMNLKISSMLGATPKKDNVIFQFQSIEMN